MAKLLVVVVSHLLRVAMGRLVNYRKCISLLSYEEKGIAKKIVQQSLEFGKQIRLFSRCYLETTDILKAAIGLYMKN